MSPGAATNATVDFRRLALEKMTRVLGPTRALQLLEQILGEQRMSLATANDLHRFAEQLSKREGFEAAVGGLLSVAAVLHGATGSS